MRSFLSTSSAMGLPYASRPGHETVTSSVGAMLSRDKTVSSSARSPGLTLTFEVFDANDQAPAAG